MAILSTTDAGAFLGIDSSTAGLAEAIDNAEALTAAQLNLDTLDLTARTENFRVPFHYQQIRPRHGPITEVTLFEVDGVDYMADVEIIGNYAIAWRVQGSQNYGIPPELDTGFLRQLRIEVGYSAGWTSGTVPNAVKQYALSMTGLTLNNLLMSGVYDTKLGDMIIKMQRETLEQNIAIYKTMLQRFARPVM